MRVFFAIILVAFLYVGTLSQTPTSVREYEREFKTYPFSDPDPVPRLDNIYPYFRFEGYAREGINKKWKVIELENDYIKVTILPEIGGKIWSAIEKSTGREFIYYNKVVKFRNIAMRGPWTSGGIEANYGIIGHTPNVATPVDYLARKNEDGSASVFIGALDLLTRSTWTIEINLPRDAAYFTTASFWTNPSNVSQSYYTWMNAAIKTSGDLEYIYPGNSFLGHSGEIGEWDVNTKEVKTISRYDNNDFGGYKSYHVFGRYTEFFGAFWHKDNFGMARFSPHDEKPGKKLWIWGLSPQGMIWESLLTDSDGQYTEVQSGRLFNQTSRESVNTPFKFRGFMPHSTETWKEYWFPVKGTEGFVAANDYGAVNLRKVNGGIEVAISPIRKIDELLVVKYNEREILSVQINRQPLEKFSSLIPGDYNRESISITLGGREIFNGNQKQLDLSRPKFLPKDFDQNSAYGLYLQALALKNDRAYAEARRKLSESLNADPNYIPSLSLSAELSIRRLNYVEAFESSRKALSIDSYDGAANYYYAISAEKLGKMYDAKDGFDLASADIAYRSAAFTELARIYFREGDVKRTRDYAMKALSSNDKNLEAMQLLVVAAADGQTRDKFLRQIELLDPLMHFPRAYRFANLPNENTKKELVGMIRNELPAETFLELAIWFESLGLQKEAAIILSASPENAENAYWLAYISEKINSSKTNELLKKADSMNPLGVFPFREESVKVFNWAGEKTNNWKPKYFLSLVYAANDLRAEAVRIAGALGNEITFAPFYGYRASIGAITTEADLQRAAALAPNEWRYGRELVKHYFRENNIARALEVAEIYANRFPENYIIGMLKARALLLNENYAGSLAATKSLQILPYEGATEGRRLYREANLQLAIEALEKANADEALNRIADSQIWLENLGVGKPYQKDIDSRFEDYLAAVAYRLKGDSIKRNEYLKRVESQSLVADSYGNYLSLLAAKELGKDAKMTESVRRFVKEHPKDKVSSWALNAFTIGFTTPNGELGDDDNRRLIRKIADLK